MNLSDERQNTWSLSACNDNIGGVAKSSDLPNWPRRMKMPMAAAYVGESISKFRRGVKIGKWPKGHRDGGNIYWYQEDLDRALDKLKAKFTGQADGWEDYIDDAA